MAENTSGSEELFRNLIPCDSYHFPFVDKYAQFGVTFETGRALGLGMLQVRSAAFTYQVTCATLRLCLDEGGELVSVPRNYLRSLPWCVTETARVGTQLEVTARHVFLDERAILTHFTFGNIGDGPVEVKPAWLGQFSGDRFGGAADGRNFGYDKLPVRETWATWSKGGLMGGLRGARGAETLPLPAIQIATRGGDALETRLSRAPLWSWPDATGEERIDGVTGGSVYYALRSQPLTLGPGERRDIAFAVELSVATRLDPVYHFRRLDPAGLDVEKAIDDARVDFEQRVALTSPPPCEDSRPAMQRKLWRARWALLRCGYQARGKAGEYGDGLACTCVPSCSGFTRVFFWDSLFSSVALSKFEPALARGAITSVFSRQTESGLCPEHSFNYHVPARDIVGAPQAPVASWAVKRYLQDHPDDSAFLDTVYPLLVRNHAYWAERGDRDRDGLAEWVWSGQTADNSPLYDAYGAGGTCGWLPPIASVQLNAFLYRDARILADLAGSLGDTEAAEEYRQGATRRAEALMRVCFVESEKRFWDYDHAAARHTRIKTFYQFWPIWAGMPIDADVKRDLIENVLLDEKQFFGPIPFPSVAYDESAYDPRGYWRGRAWPHISYWLLEMLVREGYVEPAREAARRLTGAFLREASFPENLATDGGLYDAGGSADYNWGAAAFYLIASGEYLRAGERA